MILNMPLNLNLRDYGTNTDSSMIWSPIWLNLKEDMFGPAKIMMEMFNPILLHKDMDL